MRLLREVTELLGLESSAQNAERYIPPSQLEAATHVQETPSTTPRSFVEAATGADRPAPRSYAEITCHVVSGLPNFPVK